MICASILSFHSYSAILFNILFYFISTEFSILNAIPKKSFFNIYLKIVLGPFSAFDHPANIVTNCNVLEDPLLKKKFL